MKSKERKKNKGKPALKLYRLHNSAYKSMSRTWLSEIFLPPQLAAYKHPKKRRRSSKIKGMKKLLFTIL